MHHPLIFPNSRLTVDPSNSQHQSLAMPSTSHDDSIQVPQLPTSSELPIGIVVPRRLDGAGMDLNEPQEHSAREIVQTANGETRLLPVGIVSPFVNQLFPLQKLPAARRIPPVNRQVPLPSDVIGYQPHEVDVPLVDVAFSFIGVHQEMPHEHEYEVGLVDGFEHVDELAEVREEPEQQRDLPIGIVNPFTEASSASVPVERSISQEPRVGIVNPYIHQRRPSVSRSARGAPLHPSQMTDPQDPPIAVVEPFVNSSPSHV